LDSVRSIEESRFLVGGAVRDRLLNLEPHEYDWVVVGRQEEEMLQAGFQPVGRDFPVFLHPETHDEYALARTERKTAPGYRGFTVHADPSVTLEEDLLRRDLTINAIAEDRDGNLIDPFNGEKDLRNGIFRHVSAAFSEDPVRILRIARFAARFGKWGFHIAHDTHHLMQKMVRAGEVDALVPERVWQETLKALNTDYPQRYFEVLHKCGALQKIFPELERLYGVPQTAIHHPEVDCGVHTMMVLEQVVKLSSKPTVRFAALLHDLGKGTTPTTKLPKHHGHELRSKKLAQQLCKRLKVPNEFRALSLQVAEFHTHYHRADELRPVTIVKLFESVGAFRNPEQLKDFMLCCEADQRGRSGFEDREYTQGDTLSAAFTAAQGVAVAEVIADGFKGKDIQDELRNRRARAVKVNVAVA